MALSAACRVASSFILSCEEVARRPPPADARAAKEVVMPSRLQFRSRLFRLGAPATCRGAMHDRRRLLLPSFLPSYLLSCRRC